MALTVALAGDTMLGRSVAEELPLPSASRTTAGKPAGWPKAYERQWDDERQPISYDSTWRAAAWLPSGLLRRLGLLHTVAIPQVVTGHEARLGEFWVLEMDHFSDTGLRRAELVQALTDPVNGLPLELRGHRDLTPGEGLGQGVSSRGVKASTSRNSTRYRSATRVTQIPVFSTLPRRGPSPVNAELGWGWGDAGTMYFTIPAKAFAAGDFSNAEANGRCC
ncbi:DUF1963 domain-containing protein [Streptomyces sp. NBC_00057]|uniref:DUF1963 domain-containing protein n=1 Tax=Streptomyces sp. NBC_00057 TaxID=2975634 RepID=UPI00324C3825